ncbi:MAG: TlpA family protein disulfide reductase [Saprospiraceae bacterium]|nr:TlpA family protein disulfide reductase [Saprospiraceae bacterium]MDW8485222.1 TlpA disulfide reductase family protein [Saprospiraceae bacterium]
MKRYFSVVLLCCVAALLAAQENKRLTSAKLKTLEGQTVDAQEIPRAGKITVISFWATWCSPCKKELDAILDYYEEWKEKYGMELVAVSVDDSRTAAKVPAMVAQKKWPYRILHDYNKEFQLAANVAQIPYTLVVDANGNIVYEHTGYAPGDELELEEQLKALSRK